MARKITAEVVVVVDPEGMKMVERTPTRTERKEAGKVFGILFLHYLRSWLKLG